MKNTGILIFLLILSLNLTAQYNYQNFTIKDGLSNNVITSITEDNSGNIWIGTFIGLNKFDGKNWQSYNTKDGLPVNRILCVYADGNEIWVGTTKGAAKFDGSNWTLYDIKNGLPHNVVLDIVKDNSGNIQIATKNGVAILEDSNFRILNESNGLVKSCTHSIAISDNGIWYGAHDGKVTFFDGSNFTSYKQGSAYLNPIPAIVILDIIVITNAVTAASGVLVFGILDMVIFTGIGCAIGFALPYKNNATDLLIDSNKNVWFSPLNGGLFKYDGENWTSYGPQNGLKKHKLVTDIAEDAQGNIWVSKLGGVSKFDGSNWTEYKKNSGLAHNKVLTVFSDSKDNIWIGTKKGLTKMIK